MSPVPPAIIRSLPFSSSNVHAHLEPSSSGFTNTSTLHLKFLKDDGQPEERKYFLKTSGDGEASKEMFRGEYESLNAIANAVPGFCPRALAWGRVDEYGDASKSAEYFLVTEFLELKGTMRRTPIDEQSPSSLASRLGKLHSTPAPPDPGTERNRYGFSVPTFCGDTRQPNKFYDSWADFYANERLLMILAASERQNGKDAVLRDLVEQTARQIVPRLLGDKHLGYKSDGKGDGIKPVIVHGDLWSGNADRGFIAGIDQEKNSPVVDLVYDPCACHAHSEYDLGIMRMFGGFGGDFFENYHKVVPKTDPVKEYKDRLELYEL
ncbi:hypothetical protein N7462_002668 [Penicillium macrosclerotiorum]|uniref:uncharacterized protein n=1 Tax=Penicillium macrosclerotiorum TaxID=303699 RepID=UPI00254985E1|nr:uncharacterized protein N7462_002668 [Penicillium macrosclerotiorum]KAJ5693245.1 hypothetical protein N7462_002668 [Penicillium macrosclerotiorum]